MFRVLVASALLLAACSPGSVPLPSESSSDVALLECPAGDTGRLDGSGYVAAARDCLWQSYSAGTPARFVSTGYTVEGARFTWTLTINPNRTVTARRDFVQPTTVVCRTLEREPREAQPTLYAFNLSDCVPTGAVVRIP